MQENLIFAAVGIEYYNVLNVTIWDNRYPESMYCTANVLTTNKYLGKDFDYWFGQI